MIERVRLTAVKRMYALYMEASPFELEITLLILLGQGNDEITTSDRICYTVNIV